MYSKTEKLYYENAYVSDFYASVISVAKADDGFDVILDKTAFFPEEGGQKSDTGKIGDAAVSGVRIEEDVLIHLADKEVSGEVECTLDFDARLDKMRQHTGEHILSGTICRLFGYDNVGFHLGDDDVTCDFNGHLTANDIRTAETEANKAVLLNRKITGYYPDKQTLETLDYRSKSGIEGNIRIVEIEGIDLCACCAPHVAYTGEVGLIKITEAVSYKGGMRLHIACGERALRDYQIKTDNLSVIAKALSSGQNNAADYFEKYAAETASLKQKVSELAGELIFLKANAVQETDSALVVFEDGLDMNGLRRFANALQGKYKTVCAVLSKTGDGFSFTALSDTVNMREVAKTLSQSFSARCGGSDKMIQGTVTATDTQIKTFFESIM